MKRFLIQKDFLECTFLKRIRFFICFKFKYCVIQISLLYSSELSGANLLDLSFKFIGYLAERIRY